jgi:hypothetical protein
MIPTTVYPEELVQYPDNVLFVMFQYPVAISFMR